jgi:mono/diheme cytochrome c family protein
VSTGEEARSLAWTAFALLPDTAHGSALFAAEQRMVERLRADATRGQRSYERACAWCHTGADRAPGFRAVQRAADTAHRALRFGRGAMPFFARDKLSPQDIADLLLFLTRGAP